MKNCIFLFFLITLLTSCPRNIDTMHQPFFDYQGHRGCRGLMPENTIPAMLKAMELGVNTLEMDIVITKDKKVILSHEPFFNHEITTKPNGEYVSEVEELSLNMYQIDYDSIIKYDIGLKPHPRFLQQEKIKATKPLLADIFNAIKNKMASSNRQYPYFNIETKCLPATDNLFHPEPAEIVELLMDVIKKAKMEKQVIIQSFDFRTLQYIHQHYPKIKTAMLIEDTDKLSFEEQIKKIGFTPNIYSPHYSLTNENLVKKCHQNKMKIIPWTVNDVATIEKLKTLGVDGLISDYPNLYK
jgi:glycerophosphoryl diester phosphodiesterase